MKKKIVLLVLIILIVLIAASPYIIGIYAKKTYLADVQIFSSRYKNNFKIVGDFTNGYISSKARTDFIGNDNKPILSLIHTMQHGPIIFDFKGWSDLHSYIPRGFQLALVKTTVDAVFIKSLRMLYGNDNFYDFIIDFDFFGGGHAYLKINPLTINLSNMNFKWSGLTLDGLHVAGKSKISADIFIPQIIYKDQSNQGARDFNTANVKIDLLLNMETLEFASALVSDNFNMNISSNEQVGFINPLLKFKADKYDNNGLKIYEFDSSFDKLNIEKDQIGPFRFFTRMTAFNQPIVRQFIQSVADGNVAEIQPAKILEFLSASPVIDFSFNLMTTKGKLKITNTTKIDGKDLTKLDKQSISNGLQIRAGVEIDKPIAYLLLAQYIQEQIYAKEKDYFDKNPNESRNPYSLSVDELVAVTEAWTNILLDKLREDNLLNEDANKFGINLKLEKGALYVNDKAITMSELDEVSSYWNFAPASAPETESTFASAPVATPALPSAINTKAAIQQ